MKKLLVMSNLLQIKSIVIQLMPSPVKRWLAAYAENKKIEHWKECFKTKVSKEQVDDLFVQLSLDSDVMIHSSLPEIGDIKLRYVTENLKKYVLDKGNTILCPAIPIKGSSFDYLKSIKEFDVRTAPNAMGTISLYYGRQNGAKRSLSPTHSVIAIGDRADYYTKDHHLSETPFSENSPYYKLFINGGKILMFGASLKYLTFGHVVEDLIGEGNYPIPVYDKRRFEIEVINEEGLRQKGVFRAHSHKNGWYRDSPVVIERIRNLSSTRIIHLGCGEIILMDARDLLSCLLTQLKLGVTFPGREVSNECQKRADEWVEFIKGL